MNECKPLLLGRQDRARVGRQHHARSYQTEAGAARCGRVIDVRVAPGRLHARLRLGRLNPARVGRQHLAPGRGLHSFTFQLNLSRFCDRRHPAYPMKSAMFELQSVQV